MNLGKISVQNIRRKPLTAILSILLMAFGTGIIVLLLDGSRLIEKQLLSDVRGIDMVVGAKGSPLQLILSGIYHIDDPTGNISLEEFNKLASHPMVEKAIPLAYGDNYRGYRIVGTDTSYAMHYRARLAEGQWWQKTGAVVLGSAVARNTGLRIGDHFHSSHGLQSEGDVHENFEYRVVGIMAPTGSALDKLLLTAVSSVWHVHDHPQEETASTPTAEKSEAASRHEHDHEHEDEESHQHENEEGHAHEHNHEHAEAEKLHHETEGEVEFGTDGEENHRHGHEEEEREITVGLITFRSPMGNIMLPRMVNENTVMQAALPSIEINRLFSLMGSGVKTLRYLAVLIVLISAISVFISLYQSLKERKYELVLLRVIGAGNWQLMSIILLEGVLIAVGGYLLGMIMGKLGLLAILNLITSAYQYSLDFQWFGSSALIMLPATLGLGIAAALIPALMAYRLNISQELSDA